MSSHDHRPNEPAFKLGLVSSTIFEFIVGTMIGNLALAANATHNLTDSPTLLITYMGERLGRRNPTVSKTYGYGRAKIIAALLNAEVLLSISSYSAVEAIKSIAMPSDVPGLTIMLVASVGIVIAGRLQWATFRKAIHASLLEGVPLGIDMRRLVRVFEKLEP